MENKHLLGPEKHEEQQGWWSVLADGGFLSPDEVFDLEYIAENPLSHKNEIDFLEKTLDIFETHPTILNSIQNGVSLLKEQLIPYGQSLQEFFAYIKYLKDMNFFSKESESYYELKKEAQWFEDSKGMNYMDIGHSGWGTPQNQPLRRNIKNECVWIMLKDYSIKKECHNSKQMSESYYNPLSHKSEFGERDNNIIAVGRYIEYEDKNPVLTFSAYINKNDLIYDKKIKRMTDVLDKEFNYPTMYNFTQ